MKPDTNCPRNRTIHTKSRKDKIIDIVGCLVLIVVVIAGLYLAFTHEPEPVTPETYYQRLSGVEVYSEKAEAIKETIRPAVAKCIPEGYTPVMKEDGTYEDFVKCSIRTPDMYFVEYWMLVQDSAGNQEVIIHTFPENSDASIYYRYLFDDVEFLPEVQCIGHKSTEDGAVHHLATN